jgi:hypothetical protein
VLWVGIEHEDLTLFRRELGCEVTHDGGFADPAFTSCNRDNAHKP